MAKGKYTYSKKVPINGQGPARGPMLGPVSPPAVPWSDGIFPYVDPVTKRLYVDIGGVTITIGAGDIEIGAVELKNATTDDRVNVEADGGKNAVYVQSISLKAVLDAIKAKTDNLDITLTALAVLLETINAVCAGDIASAATDSGNPVKVGGKAFSGTPTAVTDGQRVNAWYDLNGRQVVKGDLTSGDIAEGGTDSGNPVKVGGKVQNTNITALADGKRAGMAMDSEGRQVVTPHGDRSLVTDNQITLTTTTETTLLAQVASTFLDLLSLVITNTSATGVNVKIRDTTGGTVKINIYVPANDTRGVVFQVPKNQAAVNTNWTAQLSGAVSSIEIMAQAVKKKG